MNEISGKSQLEEFKIETVTHYGEFPQNEGSLESLTLVFPSRKNFKPQRWKNNSLSADFLSNYFNGFFNNGESYTLSEEEFRGALVYIANDLLENGFKYSYDLEEDYTLTLQLHSAKLVFLLSNTVDPQKIDSLQAIITQLLENDPYELYFQRLEANAENPDSTNSGLGFLTMINDYNARLAFRFQSFQGHQERILFTTAVSISL